MNNRHKRKYLIWLLLCLAGCGTQPGASVNLEPALSSNEALTRFLHGLEQGDKKAVLFLVDGGPRAQDFFAAIVDSSIATQEFKKLFTEAYGTDAWEAFQAPLAAGIHRPNMTLAALNVAEVQDQVQQWTANDENEGLCDLIPQLPIPFKKVKTGWVVNGAALFPDEKTLIGFTETQEKITRFIRGFQKAIGKPEISPEDIDYQMGKELMKVLFGGEVSMDGEPVHPDRFVLDEL